MHDYERPIALSTSVIASQNRDPKKSKPLGYGDFSFYKPLEDGDRPDYVYGSAYMTLVKKRKLPAWALFCYKELSQSSSAEYEPEEPAFIAEDAILLHPEKIGTHSYEGLLIAMESASEQRRAFTNTHGEVVYLTVPFIHTKAIAQENMVLT